MKRQLFVVLGLVASGCAFNGILEVEMNLPFGGPADHPYAVVQVDDRPPDIWYRDWVSRDTHAFRIDAPPSDPCADVPRDCNVRFSVDSQNVGLERMYMKVRFCEQPDCLHLNDADAPFYSFVIEHPFYQGCVTTWYADRAPVPVPALSAQPPPAVFADYTDPDGGCVCRTGGCTTSSPTGWDCPRVDPPVTQTIERCEVGRLGDEGDGTAGWCVVSTGQHFCEAR